MTRRVQLTSATRVAQFQTLVESAHAGRYISLELSICVVFAINYQSVRDAQLRLIIILDDVHRALRVAVVNLQWHQ